MSDETETKNPATVSLRGLRDRAMQKYERVKLPNGHVSYDSGDEVAEMLRGKELDLVYDIVSEKLGVSVEELRQKYSNLNAGMQRMVLGNRLRAFLRKQAQEEEAA